MNEFTEQVINIIQNIPKGKVATYGQIASLAGDSRAARQVARILHSMSSKYNLPWHRVVNSKGNIVIKEPIGADEQKLLLESEGVNISAKYSINLKEFQWIPIQ